MSEEDKQDQTATETLTSEPVVAHPEILAARELARASLGKITEAETIGIDCGYQTHEHGVVSLFFESKLAGYPGWRWVATLAKISDDDPITVLETELLPGDEALVAPEWVPWSVRLANYRATQARQADEEAEAAEAASAELREVDDVDPEDDLLDNDFSDYDDEIDGVDIDQLDESGYVNGSGTETDDDSEEDDVGS